MERVARILVKVDDDRIKEWMEGEEQNRDEVIADVKAEFEEYIAQHKKSVSDEMEFIEWESFCPKCEGTDLLREFDRETPTLRWKYTCNDNDCRHEFKEGEMGE